MKQWIAAACLAGLMGGACAQGYVGGTIGQSSFDVSCSFNCETTDTAIKLYGGYNLPTKLIPRLAVEVAYVDFGQVSTNGGVGLSATALAVSAAIRYNFTPVLNAVGRLGLANVDAKTSAGPFSRSDSGLNLYYGIGLEYSLSKQVKLVGALDFTDFDSGSQSGSVHVLSAGAQYSF